MHKKLTPRFWCALTLFSLFGQVAWVVENMYLNVFIYKMFNATAADISLMVAASAVAATVTTIFIGALSDKLGKRKLFICLGYILWGISIICFALLRIDRITKLFPMVTSAAAVGVSLTIILDCVMTFFGSTANDAAFNAWLTDSTDESNRGAAEGINSMMPLIAILVVFGGFMAFDLDSAQSWTWIFSIIGAVTLIVGFLGFFLIQDNGTPSETGLFQNIIYGFRPTTVKQHTGLYLHLLTFILFNIAIQIFMPYLIIYYEVSLGMSNYVLIMAPAILLAAVSTALWGRVYDRKGFTFSAVLALAALCAGFVVLFFTRATAPVFLGSLLMMSGYLCGMAVFGAKIRDLTPDGKAGMLQGVRIFSQVLIPGVVGPYIGNLVLSNADTLINSDGTTTFIPNANIFLAALIPALLVLILILFLRSKKAPRLQQLDTPFEHEKESSWENEYPRPQMKRSNWQNLCGQWELSVEKDGKETVLGQIRVPFPPESRISGIQRHLQKGEKYVYRRNLLHTDERNGKRTLLHFGAIDQIASVYLNDRRIATHTGGYLPFTVDVTEYLTTGNNELKVLVCDPLDRDLPYGKQRRDRGGMWYTPISGIWQQVWLEQVPENYISSLKISSTLETVTIETLGGGDEKNVTIHTPDGHIERIYEGNSITLSIPDPVHWTPETPYLYQFTLSDGTDTIESYFALRTVSIEKQHGQSYICLNGKPTFFHGLLDQGYFSDGIYLPASPDGYRFDILTMKKLGFNTLRKHIKIEPDIFYYYCDRYGMIVFQDMVNSGKYRFLLDTALPTVGIKCCPDNRPNRYRQAHFESGMRQTVSHLYNHPCVCYYTIFNEGWGQYQADRLYTQMKELDPSRIWDATSGWFPGQKSDVVSEHIYFRKIKLKATPERPLVLSEFGGYSCKLPEHSFNLDQTYGYRKFDTLSDFSDALEKLYLDEIVPCIRNGLCAAVLTQVSDVEDETNGLVTYDRQIIKADKESMQRLSKTLHETFDHAVNP